MVSGQNGGFQIVSSVGPKESSFKTKFSNKSITPKRGGEKFYTALGPGKETWLF